MKSEKTLMNQETGAELDRIGAYWRSVRMLDHWSELTRSQRDIIRLLLNMQLRGDGSRFKGNYCDLAEAIHVKRESVANVRRGAIDLEQRGIIRVRKKSPEKAHSPAASFTLLSYWMDSLENNITFYKLNKKEAL